MSRRGKSKILKQVVQVRAVQRLAAEMQVVRANAELHQLDARRDKSLDEMQDRQDCWSEVMSRPSLSLHFAAAWSKAILQGEVELGRIESQIEDAAAERDRTSGEWRATRARADAAQAMSDRVGRREARLREEADLADITDRFLRRSWTS